MFFFEKDKDESAVDTLGWLPLTSLIVFIAAFSIGYGPIPWVMMGKFPRKVVEIREIHACNC